MLGEIATRSGEKKTNIVAIMGATEGGRGAVRMVVDKPATARKVFASRGWQVTEEEIVAVTLADSPGALGRVAAKLGRAGREHRVPLRGIGRQRPQAQRLSRRLRRQGSAQGRPLTQSSSPFMGRRREAPEGFFLQPTMPPAPSPGCAGTSPQAGKSWAISWPRSRSGRVRASRMRAAPVSDSPPRAGRRADRRARGGAHGRRAPGARPSCALATLSGSMSPGSAPVSSASSSARFAV